MKKPGLSVYRAKRDFSKTDEPSGQTRVAPSPRWRFVIQKHAARRLHYDLRLELDGVFKSWAVTRGPSLDPGEKRLAVEVEDHPLDYGDFEGTIPHGEYGGGTVQLWDRGYWIPEGARPPEEALSAGDLKFTLEGARLHGSWVLVRMRGDRYGGKRTNWLLIKHRDASARPGDADALLEEDRSVASGRALKQITEGSGARPKPFMLATKQRARADAVWTSNSAATPSVDRPQAVKRKPALVARVPAFVEPQLAKLVDRPTEGARWAHEVKLDGYRAQLQASRGRIAIRTRSGLDWTDRFSSIAKDARTLPDCLIDGEIVALDQRGLPSFGALQAALSEGKSEKLVFYAFDLLFDGREDLRTLPLAERKARLEALVDACDVSQQLRYVAHLESDAEAVFSSACKMGFEGIVSKQLDAPYRSGRTGSWTKAKCRMGQEVVIGGWTTEAGTVRSLLAGVYRGDKGGRGGRLVYVGRVGTGYGREAVNTLLPQLKKLTREQSPFAGDNSPAREKNVRWLKPELVAEIEFAGWTGTGMIRQAAFKGLRLDKPARDVVAEIPSPAVADTTSSETTAPMNSKRPISKKATRSSRAKPSRTSASPAKPSRDGITQVAAAKGNGPLAVMEVTISKPDKALWPDAGDGAPVTKADLAEYYENVGHWMLPHLAGRPCSFVRVPNGVGTEQFFQRHAMPGMSSLLTSVKVKGDRAPYVQIDRVEALIAAAQIGALELHPWNCARGNPEVAGRLVFDLDPAPDVKFDAVITAAIEIRDRLRAAGLESFCKTTGGKGLHVVTPLTAGKNAVPWPVAKDFAHIVCAQMAQDAPAKYLDTMSKSQRVGKIFLDYLRNDRTATAVAVLSPRARAGAPVSMPIHWKEVRSGLDPKKYTVRTAPGVLRKTKPWTGYEEAARSLADAIRSITQSGPRARKASRRT
ncbi:MAG TPA: DNA ligase D [Steroidobacteraceae bacterium]|nr:DNA ligase D [Steroidobacteraceae bacterium]